MMDNIQGVRVMFLSQCAVENGRDYAYMMTPLSHIPQSAGNNCGSVLEKLLRIKLSSLQRQFHNFLHIHVV